MKKLLLAATLALGTRCWAQGLSYQNFASTTTPIGTNGLQVMTPLPGALVTVCQLPAIGSPCTNKAPIFTDQTLTGPQPNPIVADAQGNWTVFGAPGTYQYMITANGVTSGPFTFVLGLSTSGGNIPAPLNIQTLQGVPNAALFTGSDIFAKANAAFAAACSPTVPCTIYIPAARYTVTTTLTFPGQSLLGYKVMLDPGAVIIYTGTGYAIDTSLACFNCSISGGTIQGTSAAKGGIKIGHSTQMINIDHVSISGFTAGDGILDAGVNVVNIDHNNIQNNLIGIHTIGQPGFAPNAVHITDNNVIFNSRWGINLGDLTIFPGGVSSSIFNTYVGHNNLEQNGVTLAGVPSADCSGPSSCGGILDTLTVGTVIEANYFEGDPHNIVIGQNAYTDAGYLVRYGVASVNSGTSSGAYIVGNFFNSTATDIELAFSINAYVVGNSDALGKTCSVNMTNATAPWIGANSFAGSICFAGAPGYQPGSNVLTLGQVNALQALGVVVTNPIANGNPMVWTTDTGNNFVDHNGNWTMTGTASSLGFRMSNTSITWTSGPGNPTGACQTGSIYSNSLGTTGSTFWGCVANAWSDIK